MEGDRWVAFLAKTAVTLTALEHKLDTVGSEQIWQENTECSIRIRRDVLCIQEQ